jgi:5-formyltetrahydrofolate cyclo-ligase
VVVPGVAFTSDGARLGRGGGHYDQLLARRVGEVRVGIAFDLQIVPAIPEEAHDERMDLVVTPSRTWRTPR